MRGLWLPLGKINQRSSSHRAATLVSVTILLIGIIASSLFATAVANQNAINYGMRLDQQKSAMRVHVTERMASYSRLLLAASTLHTLKGTMDSKEWEDFYASMHVSEEYPSLLGIGYVEIIKSNDRLAFRDAMRAEGFGDFAIYPVSKNDQHAIIKYIQPFDALNQRAQGYDMYTEKMRTEAMRQSCQNNALTLSAPVRLVQDEHESATANVGVLIYYPIYHGEVVSVPVENRCAMLDGFVYLVLRPGDIVDRYFTNMRDDSEKNVDIHLDDTTAAQAQTLYRKDNSTALATKQRQFSSTFSVNNRTWRMTVAGRDAEISVLIGPLTIFLLGLILSTIFAYSVLFALLTRIRKVEAGYEQEVQRTKDELLALASHQLRTPASGVKQYIGMLKAGLVGDLSPTQRDVIQKAYDANERQLEIINELLYVSKIDAGQLHLAPAEVDMSALVQQVVDDFAEQAGMKNITLVYRGGAKPKRLVVDDRYVTMIVENLISNAIKYSYPSSKVTIWLKDEASHMSVSVIDRGVGLPSDAMQRIFSKFDRVHNPLSRSEGGSGLGLFLAKQLALAHRGDIQVESVAEKGSTFRLILPKHAPYDTQPVVDLHLQDDV